MTELLTDDRHFRADMRMIERAVRQGWKIPDGLMEALPKVMMQLALKGDDRTKLNAAKVLVAMHGQNQRDDPIPQVSHVEHDHTHRVITEQNFELHRQRIAQRIAALGSNSGGSAGA